jgi:nitrite reductase/ring-hydroxylating ferredoxin subunit
VTQIQLCQADEITEGEPFQAIIPGHPPFAVFKVEEQVYVVQDECTHATASLSLEGTQDGFHIICSWHEATFDIRNGKGVSGPCEKPLRAFPAHVADGVVMIEV